MIKTLDNFKIITKSGTMYDMADDFNVLVRSLNISSPKPEIETDKVDGCDGVIRLGKTWGERKITAICSLFATDTYDIAMLRNDVFKALMNKEEFYVICDAEPGKRWLVEVASEWTPNRIGTYGEFTIEFVSHSSYSESIGTTIDPLTFDAEVWQTGQGLTLDETMYTQSTATFQIYNAADGVTIDPRIMPLLITFKGASTNLQIKNKTTGDTWSYTGTSLAADEIKLDGIRSFKNGLSIFRNSNHKFITLDPGFNDFEIIGATGSFTISFSFRFYTL